MEADYIRDFHKSLHEMAPKYGQSLLALMGWMEKFKSHEPWAAWPLYHYHWMIWFYMSMPCQTAMIRFFKVQRCSKPYENKDFDNLYNGLTHACITLGFSNCNRSLQIYPVWGIIGSTFCDPDLRGSKVLCLIALQRLPMKLPNRFLGHWCWGVGL